MFFNPGYFAPDNVLCLSQTEQFGKQHLAAIKFAKKRDLLIETLGIMRPRVTLSESDSDGNRQAAPRASTGGFGLPDTQRVKDLVSRMPFGVSWQEVRESRSQ